MSTPIRVVFYIHRCLYIIHESGVKGSGANLILATLTVPGHEKVVERLEAAGLQFIAPEPVSLDDVYRDIHEIGELLGVPERAGALVAM